MLQTTKGCKMTRYGQREMQNTHTDMLNDYKVMQNNHRYYETQNANTKRC